MAKAKEKTVESVDVIEIPKNEISGFEVTPQGFIQQAITKGLGIEHLERLMQLQERWDKQQAEKAFLEAFTKFQQICPPIDKDKHVKFQTSKGVSEYNHASLPNIAYTIKNPLSECGLSYRWEFKDEANKYNCDCIVSHVNGHSKISSMSAGRDTTGSKNDIQSIGSTRTYLQRYTLIAALGLSTADEDNDGRTAPDAKSQPKTEDKKPATENKTNTAFKPMGDDQLKIELENTKLLNNLRILFDRIRKTNPKQAEKFKPEFTKKRLEIEEALKRKNEPIKEDVVIAVIDALTDVMFDRGDWQSLEQLIDECKDSGKKAEYIDRYKKHLVKIGKGDHEINLLPF